ncbi:MAG TPA: gentisate 1,2-dioxygenase [Steroidobacteraceae bacterium]|nr:gentisate 1,2-dioxygenase [Steroidobacteraceae bacterium]
MSDVSAITDLELFIRQLPEHHLAPLWEVLRLLTPREPPRAALPAVWRARELREQILTAGRLISAEQAERRVLVLENPALAGQARITTSLYAGIQLILPGELARSHRHTASALRLVLEGTGAYTMVEGERATMHPGDLVVTPSWTFHEHGNEGSTPVIWLDGLDVPIVNLLGAAFSEDDSEQTHPPSRPTGDALARYGSALLPVDYERRGGASPFFWYPYERTRSALDRMRDHGPWDEASGLKLAFTDPTTGGSPFLTMAAFVQLLPGGFAGTRYRSSDGAVFTVLEGRGTLRTAATQHELAPWDVFVIPGWSWYCLSAAEDLVLFSFSDRALQQHLQLWREQRA